LSYSTAEKNNNFETRGNVPLPSFNPLPFIMLNLGMGELGMAIALVSYLSRGRPLLNPLYIFQRKM